MSNQIKVQRQVVRTTVNLPASLLQRVDEALHRGAARSRNALIIEALETYLKELEKCWIDEQFAQMENDEPYKALNLQIAEEFAVSE